MSIAGRGSATQSDVSTVQSVTVSSRNEELELVLSWLPASTYIAGAKIEGEDNGVDCVDDEYGGGSSPPLTEV